MAHNNILMHGLVIWFILGINIIVSTNSQKIPQVDGFNQDEMFFRNTRQRYGLDNNEIQSLIGKHVPIQNPLSNQLRREQNELDVNLQKDCLHLNFMALQSEKSPQGQVISQTSQKTIIQEPSQKAQITEITSKGHGNAEDPARNPSNDPQVNQIFDKKPTENSSEINNPLLVTQQIKQIISLEANQPQSPRKQFPENDSMLNSTNKIPSSNFTQVKIPLYPSIQKLTTQKITIQNTKFDNLILEHEIPLKFYQKEIFEIRGKLKSSSYQKGVSINFILRKIQTGEKYSYSYFVKPFTKEFSFKVKFESLKGKFYFALFAGQKGAVKSEVYQILQEVLSQPSSLQEDRLNSERMKPERPENLTIYLRNNKVGFSWNKNASHPLHRLTLEQKNHKLEYFLSNFQTFYEVDESELSQFTYGQVQISLQAAYSQSISFIGPLIQFSERSILMFEACQHHFSQQDFNFLYLSDFRQKIDQNEKIQIKGVALKQLQNKFWVLNPNKTFIIDYLYAGKQEKFLKQGQQFHKVLEFSDSGVYILEINKPEGGAVLNTPIYVGKCFPILPDFYDLLQKEFEWKSKSQKSKKFTETTSLSPMLTLLSLVNQKRQQFNVPPVNLDDKLTTLAQTHSIDMIANNYFNHKNLKKQTPQQRARLMGINLNVGQNIAMSMNLEEAHQRLCRSPIHLNNIVNPNWENVGFGVGSNAAGVVYVVQQFSGRNLLTAPLMEGEYDGVKQKLVEIIKGENLEIEGEDQELSQIMKREFILQKTPINQLGFKLTAMGYSKFSVGSIKVLYARNFVQKMKGKNYLKPKGAGYKRVAIGLISNQEQYLTISIIYI